MSSVRSWLVVVGGLVVAAACGGDDPVGVGGGGGGGGGATREVLASPAFAANINEIFLRNGCTASGCHGGGQAGLVLGASAADNYAQLVNVPSTSEPAFNRVTPNDADNSYVIIKVEGRQMVGQRMPRGMAPLDNIDITNLRNWITNGAPNN